MKRSYIAVLALVLMLGTVGAMDAGGLNMARGLIRCVVLLAVAAWGTR
jgi:hypothetical protein